MFPLSASVFANPVVHEEVIMIPYDWAWELEVTVLKPDGAGPFPLVVINHGKDGVPAREQHRYRPMRAAQEFLKHGFLVVMPMRAGFSITLRACCRLRARKSQRCARG